MNKVLVVTGTRAEYGLLKPVVLAMQKSKKLKVELLATGMHTLKKYGDTIKQIKSDKMPLKEVVKVGSRDDMLTAFAKEIKGIKKYCEKSKPDLILVLGDRDEPFAAAIVAGHLKIPVAHIHGGDITGYVVDEYIRHSITKFAHLHFAASKKSFDRILKLGEEKWRVFNTGAPGIDSIMSIPKISKKQLSKELNLNQDKKWFLVVQHPETLSKTTIKKQIEPTLKAISKFDAEKIIIYPNSDTGNEVIIDEIKGEKNVFKNLRREIYINLMRHSDVMIGNSSSGVIESTCLKLPTIDIGDRQKGRERGENVISVPYDAKKIEDAITKALKKSFREKCKKAKSPYGHGKTAEKIVSAIEKNIEKPNLILKKLTYA